MTNSNLQNILKLTFSKIIIGLIFVGGGGLPNCLKAQKVAWGFFQSNADFLKVKFTPTSANWGAGIPRPKNPYTNQYFTEYLGFNIETDVNGDFLFCVISTGDETFLFDKNGNWVEPPANFDIKSEYSSEITIVPYIDGVLYHIITSGKIWEYDIAKNRIMNDIRATQGKWGYSTYNFSSNGRPFRTATQAVFPLSDACHKYRIYSLDANITETTKRLISVHEVTELKTNHFEIQKIGNGKDITNINSYPTQFSYRQNEMELSEDGSKLALVENSKIFIFEIDVSTGSIGSLLNTYTYENGNSENIGGIEFSGNNTLVFTSYSSYNSTWTGRGVYIWDLSGTSAPTKISSSEVYAYSKAEKAKDGKCYVAKSDGLYIVNISSASISSGLTGVSLQKAIDLYKLVYSTTSSDDAIYYLPEQIDGQLNEKLDLTETVWDYQFPKTSTPINWSNSTHGFTAKGNGRVLVLNSVTLINRSNVSLSGMQLVFWEDAVLNIQPGATLNLQGTELKGFECGKMWKGVKLLKTTGVTATNLNKLYMKKNTAGLPASIADAIIGINTITSYSVLDIGEESWFSRNETDISISNNQATGRIKIENCKFLGYELLHDQEKGSSNGYSNEERHTNKHILIYNSNVILGSVASGPNYFEHGQIGVNAISSRLEMYNSNMTELRQNGCWFSANKNTGKTIKVNNCNFNNLQQGIRIEMETSMATIQQNSFTHTWGYGIQYIGNHGGELIVGSETNPALGNTFDDCNWSAIECSDNAKFVNPPNSPAYGSKITIANNSINNHLYASGISVGENVTVSQSYGLLKIRRNTIGTIKPIGQGIVLRQFKGGNAKLPRTKISGVSGNYSVDHVIDSNIIRYSTKYDLAYNGIYSLNAQRINYLANNVNLDPTVKYRNKKSQKYGGCAMYLSTSNWSLANKNILSSRDGLKVQGDGLYSNYYCNSMQNCIVGFKALDKSLLRDNSSCSAVHSDLTIHANDAGSSLIFGRPNDFINTIAWGLDMEIGNLPTNSFLWDFPNSVVPKIGYTSTKVNCGIVHNSARINPCPTLGNIAIPPTFDHASVDLTGITDSILLWQVKYGVQQQVQSGLSSQNISDPSIENLVAIEAKLEQQQFQAAYNDLQNYNASNAIETAFKKVYSIWAWNRLQLEEKILQSTYVFVDTIWTDSVNYSIDTLQTDTVLKHFIYPTLSDSLVLELSAIAALHTVNTNPAAVPARAILWACHQLQFFENSAEMLPNITGYAGFGCNFPSNQPISVKLMNQNGSPTGIETFTNDSGFFMFSGASLVNLDTANMFYIAVQLPNATWLNSEIATLDSLVESSYHNLHCDSYGVPASQTVFQKTTQIIVYPNPAQGYIYFENMPEVWQLEIMDITGHAVKTVSGKGNTSIATGSLLAGIYFIQIKNKNNNAICNKKIILQ